MSQSNNPSSRKQNKRGKKRNAADLSPKNKWGNPRGAKRQRMNNTVRASIQSLLSMSSDEINGLPEPLRKQALELRKHRHILTPNTVNNNRNSNNSNPNNQNHQANQTNNHSNRNQNASRPAPPAPPKPDSPSEEESDDDDKEEEEEEKELEVEVLSRVQPPRVHPPSHRQRNNPANHPSMNPSMNTAQVHVSRPPNPYIQPQPQRRRQQMPRQPQTFQLQPPSRAQAGYNAAVQPSPPLLYEPRPRAEETYPPNGRFIDARIFVPKQEEKAETSCSFCCTMIWLICIAITAIPLLMTFKVLNIGNVGNDEGLKYCDTGSTQIKLLKDYGQCIPCPKDATLCTNGQAKCKDATYWIDTEKNECVKKKSVYQMMELMTGIVDSAYTLYSEKISGWLSVEAWKLKIQEVWEMESVDRCKQYEMEVMVTFFILTWYLPALRVLIVSFWAYFMVLPGLNENNNKDIEQIGWLIWGLSYSAAIMFAYDNIYSPIASFLD